MVDATLDLSTRSPHFLSDAAAAAVAAAGNLTPSSKFAKQPGTLLPQSESSLEMVDIMM